jgi:hypothetical protein
MISGKHVHLIESHWEQLMDRVFNEVRRDPTSHFTKVVETEWRDWGQMVLQNLGHWLAGGNQDELAEKCELLGKQRCEESVPLETVVQRLCLIRQKTLDYLDQQVIDKNMLELYAEEQLLRRLARFFDFLLVHVVRGYERELKADIAVSFKYRKSTAR